MGKKLSSLFESNKLINGLLLIIVSSMLVGNSRLGAIESKVETVDSMSAMIAETKNELIALKTQNTFIIDEAHETKQRSILTRNEQIKRSSSIDCINKISDVMGCSIPEDHPQ